MNRAYFAGLEENVKHRAPRIFENAASRISTMTRWSENGYSNQLEKCGVSRENTAFTANDSASAAHGWSAKQTPGASMIADPTTRESNA